MTSLNLFGALLGIAVSSLLIIWLLANKKSHADGTLENKTANPVSLPKGWWSNAERFQAERRAIFSQVSTVFHSIQCLILKPPVRPGHV